MAPRAARARVRAEGARPHVVRGMRHRARVGVRRRRRARTVCRQHRVAHRAWWTATPVTVRVPTSRDLAAVADLDDVPRRRRRALGALHRLRPAAAGGPGREQLGARSPTSIRRPTSSSRSPARIARTRGRTVRRRRVPVDRSVQLGRADAGRRGRPRSRVRLAGARGAGPEPLAPPALRGAGRDVSGFLGRLAARAERDIRTGCAHACRSRFEPAALEETTFTTAAPEPATARADPRAAGSATPVGRGTPRPARRHARRPARAPRRGRLSPRRRRQCRRDHAPDPAPLDAPDSPDIARDEAPLPTPTPVATEPSGSRVAGARRARRGSSPRRADRRASGPRQRLGPRRGAGAPVRARRAERTRRPRHAPPRAVGAATPSRAPTEPVVIGDDRTGRDPGPRTSGRRTPETT